MCNAMKPQLSCIFFKKKHLIHSERKTGTLVKFENHGSSEIHWAYGNWTNFFSLVVNRNQRTKRKLKDAMLTRSDSVLRKVRYHRKWQHT